MSIPLNYSFGSRDDPYYSLGRNSVQQGKKEKDELIGRNLKAVRVYHPDSVLSICSVPKTGNEEMW